MKCIRCRLEIPEGAKFCPSCGKKQPNQNTDPNAPLVWDGERTTCPRCRRGTPADTDSVFCAWCRMRLPVKQAPAVPIPVKLSGRIKACIRPCCSKAIPEPCSARGAGSSSRQDQSPHESAARRAQERSTSCRGSVPSRMSQRTLPVIYSATMQTEKRP